MPTIRLSNIFFLKKPAFSLARVLYFSLWIYHINIDGTLGTSFPNDLPVP